tara:strand:- start:266 stop:463 length:198 start_codon:yes stop_codon:yes gene_type:complete
MNIKYKWVVKITYSNNDNEINESNVIIPKDYFKNSNIIKIIEQALKDDLKMSYNVNNPILTTDNK